MSQVCAAAHAPFISAASNELLNLESFTQLDALRDLAKVFDTTDYARWKGFRMSEDSRYVCLTLASTCCCRVPYAARTRKPSTASIMRKALLATDHSKYL